MEGSARTDSKGVGWCGLSASKRLVSKQHKASLVASRRWASSLPLTATTLTGAAKAPRAHAAPFPQMCLERQRLLRRRRTTTSTGLPGQRKIQISRKAILVPGPRVAMANRLRGISAGLSPTCNSNSSWRDKLRLAQVDLSAGPVPVLLWASRLQVAARQSWLQRPHSSSSKRIHHMKQP